MTARVPTVSVILPTYNRAGTLRRAIDSVLAQQFADFELLVVDDGSTDDTPALVGSIGDSRLVYLRQARNGGVAAARNAGIRAARGSWVAFQDSDDEWLASKLGEQLDAARADPAIGLVLAGYTADTPTGRIDVRPQQTLAGREPRPDLLDGWPIITPAWLVRRELLTQCGGFDESYGCLEDWDLVFRLSDRCAIGAIPGPALIKHGSLDSVCADPQRMCRSLERILQVHRKRWHGESRRLARRLGHLGCLQFRLGRRTEARATLQAALGLQPWSAASLALVLASRIGARAMRFTERAFPRHAGMAP